MGRRARGTPASPQALQANDNIMAMQGRGYGATAFSPYSRAYMKFFAAENWTDTAQGSYITLATTLKGTSPNASATERVRITDAGNVGIGTTTPGYPLSVNGTIQSMTGGFMFPDNSVQTTAGITPPSGCTANQQLRWSGTGWVCVTGQGASSISLGSGLLGSLANNLLTLNTDPTYLQERVTGTCPSGNAIAAINQAGGVSCQTVSGGGTIALPVNWTGTSTPPTTPAGVLNVNTTATGVTPPQNGPPVFNTIPAAIVGTSTGSEISAGVVGMATGAQGVGVVGYSSTSNNPTVVAWNAVTGYSSTNGDYPTALNAMMSNSGGKVIEAQATASTAPTCAQGSNNCQETTVIRAEASATSGQVVAFEGDLASPSAWGLQLNFSTPPTSGGMISAGIENCPSGSSCPYFNVDGSGNISASGGLTVNGTANLNGGISLGGQLSLNNGLSVNGTTNLNGSVVVSQGLSIANGSPATNMLTIDGGGNITTVGGITASGNINTNANMNLAGGLTTNGGGGLHVNNGGVVASGLSTFSGGINVSGTTVFGGSVAINGTLSKPAGTFKIDHPLDPANKYLYHSFVESPDMMNIYNGNVVTDKHGVATVDLPDYFEALNQDFRYQLTVIGQFAQAIVVKEIKDNHFVIKTSKPSVKVSWQVTGVRHDAYANAHRVQVEEDKGEKRGTYLHPELFQEQAPAIARK
jgi:hypothetical protein